MSSAISAKPSSQALTRLPEPPPERRNDLRTTMHRLLATRAEMLPRLLLLQTRLAATESDAEQALRDLVDTTENFSAILDSRLLWTPSHKPVDGALVAGRIGDDAATFFNPRRWMRCFPTWPRSYATRGALGAC